MDINSVTLVGRVATEIQYTPAQGNGSSRAVFTIAVNKRITTKGRADHVNFRCVAWGKTADAAAKFLKVGKEVGIEGRGENFPVTVELKDDSTRTFNLFEIHCDNISYGHDSQKNQQRANQANNDGNLNIAELIKLLAQKGILDANDVPTKNSQATQQTNYEEELPDNPFGTY